MVTYVDFKIGRDELARVAEATQIASPYVRGRRDLDLDESRYVSWRILFYPKGFVSAIFAKSDKAATKHAGFFIECLPVNGWENIFAVKAQLSYCIHNKYSGGVVKKLDFIFHEDKTDIGYMCLCRHCQTNR